MDSLLEARALLEHLFGEDVHVEITLTEDKWIKYHDRFVGLWQPVAPGVSSCGKMIIRKHGAPR